ncbi:hypothetical protein ACFB49_33020 [Sphingomonas sp. DBB INV C78]|uniref:hypothetical protein n=1 Tax=Sphingomonas sp. DBB INV C78 TaxID=3349434 RepID=UPI0036D40A83
MAADRVVSVGFLTAQDLMILGAGFRRHFPVPHDDVFERLLEQLDRLEATPLADGVVLKAAPPKPVT